MSMIQGSRESDRSPVAVLVDEDGAVNVTNNVGKPLWVTNDSDSPMEITSRGGIAQTQDVAVSKSITTSSQSYALPERHGEYLLIAVGNTAYCETADGSAPTVTTSAGGFSLVCPEGVPIRLRLAGDYIAWIGGSAAGTLSIIHILQE